MVHDETSRTGPRLVAAGLGIAIGAAALSVCAFVIRMPRVERTTETLGTATAILAVSLTLVAIGAVLVVMTGRWVLAGRRATTTAKWLLLGTVTLTAFAYLGPVADSATARLSGPGVRPAVVLAQVSWPLLALAALLLLVTVFWTTEGETRGLRALLTPVTAIGLVFALVVGLASVAWWAHGQVRTATVSAITIAPYPTAIGSEVAYTVPVGEPENVLPTGPGFVVADGGGLVAYDGVTGTRRWSIPPAAFPSTCRLDEFRSTGTGPDSVVVAQCVRPSLHGSSEHASNSERTEAVLLGYDANTGQPLWLNDGNLEFAAGTGFSETVVAVTRNDETGSLDPRTGALRWIKTGQPDSCSDHADVVRDDVVVTSCFRDTDIRVLDGLTGEDIRTLDLRLPPGQSTSNLQVATLAVDGDTLVISIRSSPFNAVLAVDITTGETVAVPAPGVFAELSKRMQPGPLLQTNSGRASTLGGEDFVEVYSVADRRSIRIHGITTSYSVVPDRLKWARIGDRMVTAGAMSGGDRFMASVAADGSVTRMPAPCGGQPTSDGGGLLPVPGATLVLCPRRDAGGSIGAWDVLGVR